MYMYTSTYKLYRTLVTSNTPVDRCRAIIYTIRDRLRWSRIKQYLFKRDLRIHGSMGCLVFVLARTRQYAVVYGDNYLSTFLSTSYQHLYITQPSPLRARASSLRARGRIAQRSRNISFPSCLLPPFVSIHSSTCKWSRVGQKTNRRFTIKLSLQSLIAINN